MQDNRQMYDTGQMYDPNPMYDPRQMYGIFSCPETRMLSIKTAQIRKVTAYKYT